MVKPENVSEQSYQIGIPKGLQKYIQSPSPLLSPKQTHENHMWLNRLEQGVVSLPKFTQSKSRNKSKKRASSERPKRTPTTMRVWLRSFPLQSHPPAIG